MGRSGADLALLLLGGFRATALAPDEYPILAGRAQELAALDADSGYEHGLRALLDGLPNPR